MKKVSAEQNKAQQKGQRTTIQKLNTAHRLAHHVAQEKTAKHVENTTVTIEKKLLHWLYCHLSEGF